MPDDPEAAGGGAEQPVAAVLDKTVQDHLGQKLRAAYAEGEDKPAYLGDPALPPTLEHKLLELEKSEEVHEKGVEAVKDALGVTERARQKGVEAVSDALGVRVSPGPDGGLGEPKGT
jgi:hypothetical protein